MSYVTVPFCRGIIPAYAGNTFRGLTMNCVRRDHPRVCGEHVVSDVLFAVDSGSSPRMRGTRAAICGAEVLNGIIPAYAGNTMIVAVAHVHWWDHPRVCGEHTQTVPPTTSGAGSSPRMRGTPAVRVCAVSLPGIIPAYAGNTTNDYDFDTPRRDHPRVCGEHTGVGAANVTAKGSSPRMRGTRIATGDYPCPNGIIPAYAGNTLCLTLLDFCCWDHPRVCGEHFFIACHDRIKEGSSPRMRGTHFTFWQCADIWGDHPRVCGEHDHMARLVTSAVGSSPRMRGTRRKR